MYPQKFSKSLKRPKFIILALIIISLCILIATVSSGLYSMLKPEPGAVYMELAEPWAGDGMDARVAYLITVVCFLPPYITWFGTCIQFMVAAYYLQWGFRDIYSLMFDDAHLVNQLALHKTKHWLLSQMTGDLDDILRGYTGASMSMCIFDMCFVIFTLHESHKSSDIMTSTLLLIMMLITTAIIVVPSISINSWVSWYTLEYIPQTPGSIQGCRHPQ